MANDDPLTDNVVLPWRGDPHRDGLTGIKNLVGLYQYAGFADVNRRSRKNISILPDFHLHVDFHARRRSSFIQYHTLLSLMYFIREQVKAHPHRIASRVELENKFSSVPAAVLQLPGGNDKHALIEDSPH